MRERTLDIAVAGHTNTGKTSLMRTVLRDAWFGEVDDRPGVTREVEAASIALPGGARIRFIDTPGLEDAVALLEYLDRGETDAPETGGAARRDAAHDRLMAFVRDPSVMEGRFRQEAAALAQVARSDLALYVLDARQRVLARHRDELELLARCARPVVPVLNFTADQDARTQEWRDHLARSGLHAVAAFDTVVFDPADERRLYEMMRVLLSDASAELFVQLETVRSDERSILLRACSRAVADLLLDAAAAVRMAAAQDPEKVRKAAESLRDAVRAREQACVDQLLELHRFRAADVLPGELPLEGGQWPIDLFSPEALRAYGVRSAGLVATGAAIGLTVDIAMHGLSLGAGTALGAAMGGLVGAVRQHGRRLIARARGEAEIRVHDATVDLLLVRQTLLLRGLLSRGHAAMHPIALRRLMHPEGSSVIEGGVAELPPAVRDLPRDKVVRKVLRRARAWPGWSDLALPGDVAPAGVSANPADPRHGSPPAGGAAKPSGMERLEGDDERGRAVETLAERIASAAASRYTPPSSGD